MPIISKIEIKWIPLCAIVWSWVDLKRYFLFERQRVRKSKWVSSSQALAHSPNSCRGWNGASWGWEPGTESSPARDKKLSNQADTIASWGPHQQEASAGNRRWVLSSRASDKIILNARLTAWHQVHFLMKFVHLKSGQRSDFCCRKLFKYKRRNQVCLFWHDYWSLPPKIEVPLTQHPTPRGEPLSHPRQKLKGSISWSKTSEFRRKRCFKCLCDTRIENFSTLILWFQLNMDQNMNTQEIR